MAVHAIAVTPAHSCPPQKPSVLSQSQGLSPGPDPGSPRPRRGRVDQKGKQLRIGYKRRGRKPRHQADTSATVGSTPCTGLSSDRPGAASCRPPRIASTSSEQQATLPVTQTPSQDTEHPHAAQPSLPDAGHSPEQREPLQVSGREQGSPGTGVLGAGLLGLSMEG